MDPQLKQRLVGAAVLVSLAILVVPVLLDGGYRQTAPPPRDMAPMPQDSFEDVVHPLPPEVKETLDAGLEADADSLSETAAAAAEALTPPDVTPPGFAVDAAVPPPAPSRTERPPPATVASAPASPPAPPAAPPPASPQTEQWTVQLGSFANRSNAESLLGRVKATGVAGFILPLTDAGKTSFRVRAGPVAGRAAADSLRRKLEDTQGIRGMLVRHP